MGLFSKTKGMVKMISSDLNNDPFTGRVISAIENGKKEPSYDELDNVAMMTNHPAALDPIIRTLKKYLYSPDGDLVFKALQGFMHVIAKGSESAVTACKTLTEEFKQFTSYSGKNAEKVRDAAEQLYALLLDDELISELRKDQSPQGVMILNGVLQQY